MPLAPFLINSLNQTNLDVDNQQPNGGPNNYPQYNHTQQYTPNNTYLGNYQDAASPNSSFGINGAQLSPQNIFNQTPGGTNLDIENPLPVGGPNRDNAGMYNIPSGQYLNVGTSGPLTDENGNFVTTLLHQYLPTNQYKDSFAPGQLSANSTF